MKVLVTGAGGFVGGYLLQLLLKHGHEVCTIGQGAPKGSVHVCHAELDILDKKAVQTAMKKILPDAVVHLAAISNVPRSWQEPELAISVNVCGMLHVLETFAGVKQGGIFLSVGSSDAYGWTAKAGHPLCEKDICLPQNPYSISKLCAEQLALQLGERLGVKVIHTRSFNHFGPGQALGFVVSDFASQIAEIEAGRRKPVLSVGDLSAARDFTYVTDVVAAYTSLIEKDVAAGVYNVSSGRPVKIQQVLDGLLDLSPVKVEVRKDPSRMRPSEVPLFVGDSSKLRKATGWENKVNFADGIAKTLAYWRDVT